jgi:hypothetical protein
LPYSSQANKGIQIKLPGCDEFSFEKKQTVYRLGLFGKILKLVKLISLAVEIFKNKFNNNLTPKSKQIPWLIKTAILELRSRAV